MFACLISPALPSAKKKGLELLKASYATREAAAARIPQAFRGILQAEVPTGLWHESEGGVGGGRELLGIWERNIFPEIKVTWGMYPVNIGHTDFPGCFRCHDDSHASSDGRKVTQDCNACHSVLAVEEAAPEVLQELGMAPADSTTPIAAKK